MKTLRPEYPVTVLCRVFAVSRSGLYAWANGKPSKRAQDDTRLKSPSRRYTSRAARITYLATGEGWLYLAAKPVRRNRMAGSRWKLLWPHTHQTPCRPVDASVPWLH